MSNSTVDTLTVVEVERERERERKGLLEEDTPPPFFLLVTVINLICIPFLLHHQVCLAAREKGEERARERGV